MDSIGAESSAPKTSNDAPVSILTVTSCGIGADVDPAALVEVEPELEESLVLVVELLVPEPADVLGWGAGGWTD